ncbi:MAG: GDYXXLXY domain-containing protein [Elainella sp. C42_A2020_010]|nr:GDYXXLXY domain-containing protein [Elainella sp. C42_A2020_010]
MTSHPPSPDPRPQDRLPEQIPPLPQLQPSPPVANLPRRLPSWRLWLPLLFQTGLILAVPAQDAYTYVAGRQITLQTAPVDPYDLLRGHYQTLGYEISRSDELRALPGGEWFEQHQFKAGRFYLVLEAPATETTTETATETTPPKPWQPVRISATRPTNLAANQVAIQGRTNRYGQISYGLETYYMPEAQRNALNSDISQTQDRQAFVVDVKVDGSGNAVPISLWVKQRNYRF